MRPPLHLVEVELVVIALVMAFLCSRFFRVTLLGVVSDLFKA